jgi:hypothetical protein
MSAFMAPQDPESPNDDGVNMVGKISTAQAAALVLASVDIASARPAAPFYSSGKFSISFAVRER